MQGLVIIIFFQKHTGFLVQCTALNLLFPFWQASTLWCERNIKNKNHFQYSAPDKMLQCRALFKIFKNLYNILNFPFNAAPFFTIDQIFAKIISENFGTPFLEKPNLIHSTIWKFYWVSVKQLLLPIYIICEANTFLPVQYNEIDLFPLRGEYLYIAALWQVEILNNGTNLSQ